MESRIQILDRLSAKWGQRVEEDCETFLDFCMYFDGDAVTRLVYIAMQEHANQWHNMLKEKEDGRTT